VILMSDENGANGDPPLKTDPGEIAYDRRREALARLCAAGKMQLLRDPVGQRLPDELWQQMLPQADAILTLLILKSGDRNRVVESMLMLYPE
jgi:hypothetical protein